ncbi:MAG: hypothetical protein M3498_11110, partial [Deinococcota bacterium]|nr:hypothetical protein [Deinococcota bacterium]
MAKDKVPDGGIFDSLTRDLGRATSRREALRLLSVTVAGGLLTTLGVGCGSSSRPPEPACPEGTTVCGDACCQAGESCTDGTCQTETAELCLVASACGSRQYCNEEETCLCVLSAEGDIRCGQLPNTCYLPLCTSSADCAYLGAGYFCDAPNSGCCSDPPAELSRCIAPCGAPPCPPEYLCAGKCCAERESCKGGVCCAEENICGDVCCSAGESCIAGACVDIAASSLVLSATNQNDLLFYSRRLGNAAYYQGTRSDEGMAVSYVSFESPAGDLAAVILNEDYLPIQWIMPELTVEVRRRQGEAFDPHSALHLFAIGSEQQHASLDIYPSDLREVVNKMEAQEGESFENARRFLETTADSYSSILELIRQGGQDQPRLIAAAIGFSLAAALLEIDETVSPAGDLRTSSVFSQ